MLNTFKVKIKTKLNTQSNMITTDGNQSGAVMHHHDQSITSQSFKTRNTRNKINKGLKYIVKTTP